MTRKQDLMFWIISCEGHTDAWVNAPNWEMATVAAAEFWGVPWPEVAAKCECKQKKPAVKGVCPQCGKYFLGRQSGATCARRRLWMQNGIYSSK